MAWTQEKINETVAKIAQKSKNDREYRDLVLKDPKKVIAEVAGEEVPDVIKVNFVEQNEWNKTIILPEFEGDELSDDDLENVAGGRASKCPRLNRCGGYDNRVDVRVI